MARQTEVRYVSTYMIGSAAYQLEPVRKPKKAARLPKVRKEKKIIVRIDPLTILGFAVAAVMLVSMLVGMIQLNAAQREAAQLMSYIETLEEKNAVLEKEYREGYDLAEIQRYAEAMGLIPIWEAERLYIPMQEPVVEQEPTAWEDFCMFLAGLFA